MSGRLVLTGLYEGTCVGDMHSHWRSSIQALFLIFTPFTFGWNLAHTGSWTVIPGCRCNKYNFSARWLLPEAGSEMSILIKHFTFNYISRFAHGDTCFHHMDFPIAILVLFSMQGNLCWWKWLTYEAFSFFLDLIDGMLFSER